TNPYQYTGRDYDSETGLRYYRARYYSADVGRFLTEDPISFRGGVNFYVYIKNNSPNLIDPTGLASLDKSCDCGWSRGDLMVANTLAAAATSRITDNKLRDCIFDKLNRGKIKCQGKKCDKGSKPDKHGNVLAGWALPWGDTIHLCQATTGDIV